jgi:hypothetical protein
MAPNSRREAKSCSRADVGDSYKGYHCCWLGSLSSFPGNSIRGGLGCRLSDNSIGPVRFLQPDWPATCEKGFRDSSGQRQCFVVEKMLNIAPRFQSTHKACNLTLPGSSRRAGECMPILRW